MRPIYLLRNYLFVTILLLATGSWQFIWGKGLDLDNFPMRSGNLNLEVCRFVPELSPQNIWRMAKASTQGAGMLSQLATYREASLVDCPSLPLGVTVDIVGVDYPKSGTCGNFNVLVDIEICNNSDVSVKNIEAVMDLASDFGSVFKRVASKPTVLAGTIAQSSLNNQFNGNTQKGLIKDVDATLGPGICSKMRVVFEVAPDAGASSKLAQVAVKATDLDAICESPEVRSSEALGDCWQKSRVQAANDQVNVTLGACTALITPDMILENHFYDCDIAAYPEGGFYHLKLIGPGDVVLDEGPTVTIDDPSLFPDGKAIVMVENVSEACRPFWGYIQLEDKTAAVVAECPEDVYTACVEREVQILEGNIPDALVASDVINFSAYSCFIEDGSLPSCDRSFDLIPFQVDKEDIYTFELSMEEHGGLMGLFQNSFDPKNPCENIIAQSDVNIFDDFIFPTDGRLEARVRMVLPLKPDVDYFLLTTHSACESNEESYRYTIYSDGDGEVKDLAITTEQVCYDLLCDDVPFILDKAESVKYIPGPIFTDNCTTETNLDVSFSDELFEEGDCGAIYIVRTWMAKDEAGNEEAVCMQTIHFRRPGLEDIHKPNTTVPIECDEDFPTLANGNPTPEHTGYPYVVSAFGIHDLSEKYCNVGADYEDIARIDVCENSYKIVRQWTLLDWCEVGDQNELNNSPLVNFRQIIKIGDFSGPVVECPLGDLRFSTSAFDCGADFPFPPPIVTDNCSDSWTISVQVLSERSIPVYDKYGGLIDYKKEEIVLTEGPVGSIASDIPIGDHWLRYIVLDDCGNKSVKDCPIQVYDGIEPVVVCNDDLHVSVGGDGIARVAAVDVDEGSWDNCTQVGLKVSRAFSDVACRDAYLNEVFNLTMGDLKKKRVTGPNGERNIYIRKTAPKDTILRRKGNTFLSWWEDEVYFTCCDIDKKVTLELLAVDTDGLVSSYWNGSSLGDYCWLELTVEDKIVPICVPPAPITMNCDEMPYGFDPEDLDQLAALFGTASFEDNCPGVEVLEGTPKADLTCGFGTIFRTFEVVDAQGKKSFNECTQKVEILARHDYDIKFPKDAAFRCGEETMPDTIMVKEHACDLLTVNSSDEFFEASGDECYKIFRTYKVINWCEYDGESDPVVVGRDEDCDGKGGNKDVWVLVRKDGSVYYDQDDQEDNDLPKANKKGISCDGISNPEGHWISTAIDGSANPARDISSNGYWQYTQIIKVYDNTVPEINIAFNEPFCILAADECLAEVYIPFDIVETCGHHSNFKVEVFFDEFADEEELVDVSSRGLINRFPKYAYQDRLQQGSHIIEIVVSDGCGNVATQKVPIEVVDCKVVAPNCIHGLSVELMRTEPGMDADGDGDEDAGAQTIWATDFVVSPNTFDCSGEVTYSINRVGEIPSPEKTSLTVTCDDFGDLPVEIYAWDQGFNPYLIQPDGTKGGPNFDLCQTILYVQDNLFNLCSGPGIASVSGLITTEENETIEKVKVRLSGGSSNDLVTQADGIYLFSGLTEGGDYTILPELDEDFLNGVSTFDMVKITKHILGTERLDSPYKLLAADVNNSSSVTALDLIQLRKLILSVDRRFRNNTSWRFIRADYVFPNPENPWKQAFPELISFNDLAGAVSTADFIGVKIGDVTQNAKANSLIGENRSVVGKTYLELPDMVVKAGEQFRVPVRVSELGTLQGLQFALRWDFEQAELMDVEYGVAKGENLGLGSVEEGLLLSSWNQSQVGSGKSEVGSSQSGALELFGLVFRAKADLRVEELFSLSSRDLQAEAYGERDELLDIGLEFQNGRHLEDSFHLYQNQPNPFQESTQIGFYLPEAISASLTIYDVNGKVIRTLSGNYDRGEHQVHVDLKQLPHAGVYYYTLRAGAFTDTRKMVLID